MSEWPEALVERVAKGIYISPVSDHWGETVPEISAVCERAAIAALDALGLREEWAAYVVDMPATAEIPVSVEEEVYRGRSESAAREVGNYVTMRYVTDDNREDA